MDRATVLKVFFPQCLLNASSGVCLGFRDKDCAAVCIVSIAHSQCHDALESYLKRVSKDFHLDLTVVGLYTRGRVHPDYKLDDDRDLMIELEQRHHNGIPACNVRLPWQHTDGEVIIRPLFIIFDEAQVMKANIRASIQIQASSSQAKTGMVQCKSIKLHQQQRRTLPTEVEFTCTAVQSYTKFMSSCVASSHFPITHISPDVNGRKLMNSTWKLVYTVPVTAAKLCCKCVDFLSHMKFCRNTIVRKVLTYPATGAQLADKCHHVSSLVRSDTETADPSTKCTRDSTEEFIKTGNTVCSLLVDLLLGILLLAWMYMAGVPQMLVAIMSSWADTTAIGLQQLLRWLMGAPAGLKLNTSLAHFLGTFFLYHVYLWIGYLNIVWPMMTVLLWCIAGSGILGLSVQLAMTSDLLSLLTFHIYCFYVYAARIYSLQAAALLSLARLFRGKKWNVLRQRVDSCSYDVDQLFMGTLLFTILLFLLPTTALFYFVFTALRLVTLILQSLLSLARNFLHTFPWFSVLMWLLGSNSLNSGVEFHIQPSLPWQPTCLVLQMQKMPFGEALKLGRNESSLSKERKSLLHLSMKVIRGQLIYPWGGDREESS